VSIFLYSKLLPIVSVETVGYGKSNKKVYKDMPQLQKETLKWFR
jgi:hypothetical protein